MNQESYWTISGTEVNPKAYKEVSVLVTLWYVLWRSGWSIRWLVVVCEGKEAILRCGKGRPFIGCARRFLSAAVYSTSSTTNGPVPCPFAHSILSLHSTTNYWGRGAWRLRNPSPFYRLLHTIVLEDGEHRSIIKIVTIQGVVPALDRIWQ